LELSDGDVARLLALLVVPDVVDQRLEALRALLFSARSGLDESCGHVRGRGAERARTRIVPGRERRTAPHPARS
jgi:hypothetical protein